MGRHKIDIAGRRYGRLTALWLVDSDSHGNPIWLCKCDCGNYKRVRALSLGRDTNSCGCIKTEKNIERLAEMRERLRIKRQNNKLCESTK